MAGKSGLIFFADNNFYLKLIYFMRQCGENYFATKQDLYNSRQIDDEVWIPRIANEDLVILSRDIDMLIAPVEYEALRANNAKAIFFMQPQKQESLLYFATWFLACWPKVLETAKGMEPGDMYVVQRAHGIRKINWSAPIREDSFSSFLR